MVSGRAKGRFLTAVQHKWRALTVSAMRFGITPAPPTVAIAVTWSGSPPRSVLRFSNLGSFGQTGQPPRRKPVAAKKPRRGVPPGHDPYFWIVRLLHKIRVTRVKVTIAEPGRVARPRVRPACDRRYAVASPLMIQRRKICRPNSAVRPQPADSRSWPSIPPPKC
jgi:hypothetical protein